MSNDDKVAAARALGMHEREVVRTIRSTAGLIAVTHDGTETLLAGNVDDGTLRPARVLNRNVDGDVFDPTLIDSTVADGGLSTNDYIAAHPSVQTGAQARGVAEAMRQPAVDGRQRPDAGDKAPVEDILRRAGAEAVDGGESTDDSDQGDSDGEDQPTPEQAIRTQADRVGDKAAGDTDTPDSRARRAGGRR